jgi:hypothetical protein
VVSQILSHFVKPPSDTLLRFIRVPFTCVIICETYTLSSYLLLIKARFTKVIKCTIYTTLYYSINFTLKNGLTVQNIMSFFNKFYLIFVVRYLVTLLISLGHCEYVPSSGITIIPLCYSQG